MIIYEKILKEFQKQKVKYLLVGGIAVNLLGSFRNTADMDILVDMADENLRKIITILKKNGYHVKQPVEPLQFADEKIRKNWIKNKNMKVFNFYKDDDLQEVDIIIDSPVSYQKAKKNAIIIKMKDLNIQVISIDDLIKMKQKAGRKIDQADIEELQIIKKIRRKL